MHKLVRISAFCLILSLTLALSSGCTYLGNRWDDTLDIVDVGVTVTPDWMPQVAVYSEMFAITPLGYSNVDGKMLGIGNRQIGWLDYEHLSCGLLICGSEKKGCGAFNAADLRQARPDQADATERPAFSTGLHCLIVEEDTRPPIARYTEANQALHLGWLGLYVNARPMDLIDFTLGLVPGVDILGDDERKAPEAPAKEPALEVSKMGAYFKNRANDALDMFELGLTLNKDIKPQGGLFLNFFTLMPLGYNSFEGQLIGITDRKIGQMDYVHQAWGYGAQGRDYQGAVDYFDANDPHQARPDQADLTERPWFVNGFSRDYDSENRPPYLHYFQCDRILHVGWIGIHLGMCPFDVADFLAGWTTYDFMKDDKVEATESE